MKENDSGAESGCLLLGEVTYRCNSHTAIFNSSLGHNSWWSLDEVKRLLRKSLAVLCHLVKMQLRYRKCFSVPVEDLVERKSTLRWLEGGNAVRVP